MSFPSLFSLFCFSYSTFTLSFLDISFVCFYSFIHFCLFPSFVCCCFSLRYLVIDICFYIFFFLIILFSQLSIYYTLSLASHYLRFIINHSLVIIHNYQISLISQRSYSSPYNHNYLPSFK